MCGLGVWELLIVLVIVLLLFGASRLPQIGKALGETVRNFKKGVGDSQKAVTEEKKKEPIEVHEVGQLEGETTSQSERKGEPQS
jgi:sec-independent protein translocase protein TatA